MGKLINMRKFMGQLADINNYTARIYQTNNADDKIVLTYQESDAADIQLLLTRYLNSDPKTAQFTYVSAKTWLKPSEKVVQTMMLRLHNILLEQFLADKAIVKMQSEDDASIVELDVLRTFVTYEFEKRSKLKGKNKQLIII